MKYQNMTKLMRRLSQGTAIITLLAVGSLSASTVGYWRFEEGAFRDNTDGSTNDLTETGSPMPAPAPLTNTGPGTGFPDPIPQSGLSNENAVTFDGSNGFESGDVGGGNFPSSADIALTFEVFFTADALTNGTDVFGGIWDDGNNKTFTAGVIGGDNQLRFVLRGVDSSGSQSNEGVTFGSLPSIETGKDYYAAFVVDGSSSHNVTAYLQNLTDGGALESTTGTADTARFNDHNTAFTIGSVIDDGPPNFIGLIDEVRVSNTALAVHELLMVSEPPEESERPLVRIAAANAPADVREEADHVAEGADDHAAIQSVIDAFSYWGGDIILTEGTYEVSAPIEIPSHVKLIGAGMDKTLLRLDPGNVSLGLNTGVIRVFGTDAEVRDLAIDGSNPDNRKVKYRNNRSSGIYLDMESSNALLENIAVRNTTRHGIAVLGRGHVLRNVRAEKAGRGYCISIGDGSRARPGARNIRAEDLFVRDSGGRGGIEINDGIDGVVIDGFYSGGHGNHTRGAVHIREHARSDEFVRNVTVRDGVIDMRDVTVDYERPSRHGVMVRSTREYNPFENIAVEKIEFRHVHDVGVLLQGNLDGVRLNQLDFAEVGGASIRVESIGGSTPRNITVDGRPLHADD